MEKLEQSLSAKATEGLRPNSGGHPSSLNHYSVENIQRKRAEQNRKNMSQRLPGFIGVSPEAPTSRRHEGRFDIRSLFDAHVKQLELETMRREDGGTANFNIKEHPQEHTNI